MNDPGVKALVQVLTEIKENQERIEKKIDVLLADKRVIQFDTHRELFGSTPKPSKVPDNVMK